MSDVVLLLLSLLRPAMASLSERSDNFVQVLVVRSMIELQSSLVKKGVECKLTSWIVHGSGSWTR